MVTAIDDANAAASNTLSLPVQSDSSDDDDDDDSVEKTSTGVANATITDKECRSTKSLADASLFANKDESSKKTHRRRLSNNARSMTSFDIEETSPSPTKKRRVHSEHQKGGSGHVWDGFVRRGTCLKGLFQDAMQLAASHQEGVVSDGDEEGEVDMRRRMTSEQHNHAADIAREKTAECLILQKKLKEAEANAAAMTATNASLREAASASNQRMERTVEALRIAGTNAANARADADAAEACAASMATQLQALRDVVDETKRASQILYKEHEQVSAGARSIEAKLLQKETELARAHKEQRQWMEEKEGRKKRADKLQDENKSLENEMNRLAEELHEMKHQADEYAAVEQARKDRSAMVEKELREARNMLMEATSTAAETETTAAALNDAIQGLETENKSLHETIEKLQEKARAENERLNDALSKAEKEAQSLRVKAASHEEDIQRIRMDKSASEKEVAKLKSKVSSLERRLKDATSYAPTLSSEEDSQQQSQHIGDTASRARGAGVAFSIPPLPTTTPGNNKNKENHRSHRVTPAPKSSTCSICTQPASGFMKSCQCGSPSCNMRAHATCIAKSSTAGPSVSHPGTPAMRPPVILCGSSNNNK